MANLRQLPSGKWQVRVYVDGKYKSIGTFNTHKEAEAKGNEADNKIYYGESLDDREMQFTELVDIWMEHKKNNVKDGTLEGLEMNLKNYIMPSFGNKRLFKIRRRDIIKWINKYANKEKMNKKDKYKYNTRLKMFSVLNDIFNYAVYELEALPSNPCDKLTVPNKDKIRKKDKHYSLDELNMLLDYLKDRPIQKHKEYNLHYVLAFFLSRTGLRISEALALTWEDIKGDMLTIDKQVDFNEETKVTNITTLKNDSSYRTIKLDKELLNVMKEFKRTQNKVILKYSTFVKSNKDIIFQNNMGDYYRCNSIRADLRIYCKNANVTYKGTHTFRHTHAILSLEAGASLKYISKRLGHESIKTTADEYLDVTEKIEDDEIAKIESHMARKWHDDKNEESR